MSAVTLEQIRAMYALYQQGKTLEQVGEQFYYTGVAVGRIFRRCGFPTRSPGQSHRLRRIPQTLRMYRDYEAGMSLQQLGEKYRLATSTIWRRFHSHGLVMRPANGRGDSVAL